MFKSKLPTASMKTLKSYKTILNNYYESIKSEDDANNLKKKSLTFLKSFNKAVKETKGIGKVKTKINWQKAESDINRYTLGLINNLEIKGNYAHNMKVSDVAMAVDQNIKMLQMANNLTNIQNDIHDDNKLQSALTLLRNFTRDKYFELMMKQCGLNSKFKKLEDTEKSFDQESITPFKKVTLGLAIENFRDSLKTVISAQRSAISVMLEEKVLANLDLSKEYLRETSSTLVAIKTAKDNITVKNVMNVISLVEKHHPIALRPTTIKINNCLKKKNF